MSTDRYEAEGIAVNTYAGPPVTHRRRRRWQITNELTGQFVTMSEDQWDQLADTIRRSTATPPLSDREL